MADVGRFHKAVSTGPKIQPSRRHKHNPAVEWSSVSPISKITRPCRGSTRHDSEADGDSGLNYEQQQMTTLAEGLSRKDQATYDETAAKWSLKTTPISSTSESTTPVPPSAI